MGGHFLNYATTGTLQQTTTIAFNSISGCSSSATYFRNQLVTTGGFPGNEPGATVNFDGNMNATYVNFGCSAPINPFSANWSNPGPLCTGNNPIDLNNFVTGTPGGIWTGEGLTGSIFDPSGIDGSTDITYTVLPPNDCIELGASLTLTIQVTPSVDAEFSNPGPICGSVGSIDLNTLLTDNQGGTWTGLGVSGSTMDVSGLNGQVAVGYSIGSGICLSSHTEIFEIIQLPPLIIQGDTEYCESGLINPLITDPEPGAQVLWFSDAALSNQVGTGPEYTPVSGESATYFSIQIMDGCTSEVSSVDVSFVVIASPEGDTLLAYCEGSLIPELSVTATGTISWYDNSDLLSAVGQGETYQPSQAEGVFYVTNEVEGCTSAPLTIVLNLLPELTASILTPDGTSLCQNPQIQLISDQSTLNSWSTGDNTEAIFVSEAGTYTLTREGPCNTATDEIVITGAPVFAEFTVEPDSGYIPLNVNVVDFSSGSDVCTWFLDGDTLNFNPGATLSFPDSGSYQLMLICSNSEGCIDTAMATIKAISDELLLTVPNVFTPNGDLFNEQFKVAHNAVKTFEGRIFDRWGKLLYTWQEVTGGWDGTLNGDKAPEGTYFYIITGSDIKDQSFDAKGTVLLLR
jgi:gliding motility-associated-like protein